MAAPAGAGRARAWLAAGLTAGLVIALDQGTKALVRANVPTGSRRDLALGLDLVHLRNTGIAFGLFNNRGAVVSVAIFVALAVLVVYFARHAATRRLWLPTGMMLGGAVSNLVDRARLGGVTDFIDPPWWPAFNLADAAITVGVLGLIVVLDLERERAP